LIVVGVGVVVGGSVPTGTGSDGVGLLVVGGIGGVVGVGTSLGGTVTTAVEIDVDDVGASGVAGGSTGAIVV
jgi:hypothetical protein